MTWIKFVLMLYFFMVAHKAACQTLSKAFSTRPCREREKKCRFEVTDLINLKAVLLFREGGGARGENERRKGER